MHEIPLPLQLPHLLKSQLQQNHLPSSFSPFSPHSFFQPYYIVIYILQLFKVLLIICFISLSFSPCASFNFFICSCIGTFPIPIGSSVCSIPKLSERCILFTSPAIIPVSFFSSSDPYPNFLSMLIWPTSHVAPIAFSAFFSASDFDMPSLFIN